MPSDATPSPLHDAAARIGDRWTLLVVAALLPGARRFGELLEALPGLAPNVLSRRLKQLEADGVVRAEPYSHRPLRVAYRLTAAGTELAGALRLLAQWGAARTATGEPPLRHDACGTGVEARWWCPTCDQVVDDADAADLIWI